MGDCTKETKVPVQVIEVPRAGIHGTRITEIFDNPLEQAQVEAAYRESMWDLADRPQEAQASTWTGPPAKTKVTPTTGQQPAAWPAHPKQDQKKGWEKRGWIDWAAQEWPKTNGEPKPFGDDLPVQVPWEVVPQSAEEPQPVDVPPPTGEDKVDETTDFEIVNHPQTGIPEYLHQGQTTGST